VTTVALLADPPRPGLVLPALAETSPLTDAECADFYAAMLQDAARAVERSGGDLLVNYRPDDLLPDEHVTDTASEAAVRALVAEALEDPGEARYEPQVGSTLSARAGNTVSHLLREEGVQSVAVVRGNVPVLPRTVIDSAAMKLRSTPTILGPSTEGRVYYAAFADTLDFDGAFTDPEVETLTERALDAGHEVDFVAMHPTVETGEDLLTVLPALTARKRAGRLVPDHVSQFLGETGLAVVNEGGESRVTRR
jgi:glycosyltransferase A (GT-A) superfamily protein (DUF2064 family)